jgi:photosynthetic reaction center H subunit
MDHVKVKSITADQFTRVPGTRRDDMVTLLEEDKIMAYYAGGHLYARASRAEPLL